MTHKVPMSAVGNADFAGLVNAHLAALEEWRKHMANVGRDPRTYQPFPAPSAHPHVESALREVRSEDGTLSWTPDYEMVDDREKPEVTLRGKKNQLLVVISQMQQEATSEAVPRGKQRYENILFNELMFKESRETEKGNKPTRTAEEILIVERHESTADILAQIERHFAKQHYEIEELTVDDVDAWRPREFAK